MAITAISTDWGIYPRIVRIVTTDDLAAITTAGYVTGQAANIQALQNGNFEWTPIDEVLISYGDGQGFFTYDMATAAFVGQPATPGSLSDELLNTYIFVGSAANVATGVPVSGDLTMANTGAATVAAGAITNAKVNAAAAIAYSKLAALPSADILVGSAGNVATAVAMSGDATISNTGVVTVAAGAIGSGKLAENTLQYVSIPVTAAQIALLYADPLLMIAAIGAHELIVIDHCVIEFDYNAVQYTAGGVLGLQYGNSAHLAGVAASSTEAAATINGFTADNMFRLTGATAGLAANMTDEGIFLSNATQAFATGDGTMTINLTYHVVATTA